MARSVGEFDHMSLKVPARPSVTRNTDQERSAAVRAVCSMAADATEAREVLAMLGLDPSEGRT